MNIDKAIKGFFITEDSFEKNLYDRIRYYYLLGSFEKNLYDRIRYYYLLGFRVRKPATHRNDIIYPKGKHREEHIDEEILKLCYWVLTQFQTNVRK